MKYSETTCLISGLSLHKCGDSFRKVVVTAGASRLWTDDDGISYAGILTFLLDPRSVIAK